MDGINSNSGHDHDLASTIGQTPMVRLGKLFPESHINVLAKIEHFNPTCSIKDRMVRHVIDDAERTGALKQGGTIVENTSGNTGAAVAMIAAARGYKAILTMPDKVSEEKQAVLRLLGAEIVVCPTSAPPDSDEHYVKKAKVIAAGIPDSFMINQYDNPKNAEAHYLTTGPEIWSQTGGRLDYYVASGSTGGTVSGAGLYLKEQDPSIRVVMPDPIGSIYYGYFKNGEIDPNDIGTYSVEGVGEDHIAKCMDFSVLDDVIQFSDNNAFQMALKCAKMEGLLVGTSSGANLWACGEIAKQATEPTTIVTVLPDSGLKYVSKYLPRINDPEQ